MLSNKVVLVVDDSSTVRAILRDVLRRYLDCRNILEAANGQEAVQLIHEQGKEIDWIFCDWEMPEVTGDQVLAEARKNPATAHTPFVMITVRADRESLMRAVESGVDAYVIKPFTAPTLVKKVRAVLGRPEKRRAGRVKVLGDYKISLGFGDGALCQGKLYDISATGALLRIENGLDRGVALYERGVLTVSVDSDLGEAGAPLELPGEVVRVAAENPYGEGRNRISIALRFVELNDKQQQRLVAFLKKCRKRTTVPGE